MATETNQPQHNPSVLSGLAMVGGLGIVLLVTVAGLGVIAGETANSSASGIFFLAGVGLLVVAIVGWAGYVQPQKSFDDIDQPAPDEHGHGHEHHDDAHAEAHPATH